tara:strand:- start:446 stop:1372 length:927 start_codon:yes stop_codon:yes gene_type:complete
MIKDKKIVFMGTPTLATEYLSTLIVNNIKVTTVFTQPPKKKSRGMKISKSPVHILAEQNEINILCPHEFDITTINNLIKQQPDLIIVMAYGKILPKVILDLPKYGCINIHVSLLPRWRGAAPLEHTLMSGDTKTGITIFKLTEKLDAGPIIVQKKFIIPERFNKLQLSNSLTTLGTKLLTETIIKIFNNEIVFKDQNEGIATYADKITSDVRKINFYNSTKNIINQIRAHAPKPGAWFYLNNERIKIIDAKPGTSEGEKSTILNSNFEIGCKDGSILPLILQREGKKVVTIDDFLRGFKIKIHDVINV